MIFYDFCLVPPSPSIGAIQKLSCDYRLAICSKCGLIADRDVAGAMNIWLKFIHAYAGEFWVSPKRSRNEG